MRTAGLAIVALLLWRTALAGTPSPEVRPFAVRRYTVDEGLPQASVNAILQTDSGHLWIGTFGGLARFDGVSFTVVPTVGEDAPPIPRILALHEGPSGTIWAGTEGAGLLRVEHGRLAVPRELPGAGTDSVVAILEEQGGRLWAGLTKRGLVCMDHGQLKTWGASEGLAGGVLETIFPRPGGGVLVSTSEGIVELAGPGAPLVRRNLPFARVNCFLTQPGGWFLAGSAEGGLLRITRSEWSWLVQPPPDQTSMTRLAASAGKTVWAWLPQRGLFRIEEGLPVPMPIPELDVERVRTVFVDNEGSIWLGSDGSGLFQLLPADFRMIGRKEGLPSDSTGPVAQDRNGDLWAGVACAGLVRIRGREIRSFGAPDGIRGTCISSICPLRDGTVLASSYSQDLYVMQGDRATLHPASPIPYVAAVFEDREGTVWVGTRYDGVVRIAGGRTEAFGIQDGLPSDEVVTFAESENGPLYMGTAKGVAVWRNGRVEPFRLRSGHQPRKVRALLPEGRRLWIGSYGDGLSVVMNGRLFRFGKQHGLIEDVASFIHRDEAGFLWWTGNRGIYRASLAALVDVAEGRRERVAVRPFGTAEGLASAETNGGFMPAGWRTRDGLLVIPTVKGIATVDPRRISEPHAPPPVHLAEVLADGNPLPQTGHGELHIPAGTRRLHVAVSAPAFREPARLRFRKRLDGFDSAWVDGGSSRASTFTGLPAGHYVLRVQASFDGDQWSRPGLVLPLSVEPRFTETVPFRILAVFCGLAILAGAWGLRVAALRHRNVLLKSLVRRRTEELEEANRHLARLAEIDELTGLVNRRSFEGRFEKAWADAAAKDEPLSLLMIDVDFFKRLNDALGHPRGDNCLRRLGAILSASAYHADDIAARYGGEEFAVVLRRARLDGAARAAERLRQSVERLSIPHPDSSVGVVVTISVGFATAWPRVHTSPGALIAAADSALYRAKAEGRNRTCQGSVAE